jgi:hypothetical protein
MTKRKRIDEDHLYRINNNNKKPSHIIFKRTSQTKTLLSTTEQQQQQQQQVLINNDDNQLLPFIDIWYNVILFLDTTDWIQLSYTCKLLNQCKYKQLLMFNKKRTLRRSIDMTSGKIWSNCRGTLFNIDLNRNRTVDDECFQWFNHCIHTLDMSYCNQQTITNNAFKYLTGIHTLRMNNCNQSSITDEAFLYLSSVRILIIARCNQFSNQALQYLNEIESLNVRRCNNINIQGCMQLKNSLKRLYMQVAPADHLAELNEINQFALVYWKTSS